MKRSILIAILFGSLFLSYNLFAQIPNAGFEAWTNGVPDSWLAISNIGLTVTPITKSTDAHGGSAAVKGEVASFMGAAISPILTTGVNSFVFSYTGRPKTFSGWYKLISVQGDNIAYSINLKNGDNQIAFSGGVIKASTSSYTQFSSDLEYLSESAPDQGIITFTIGYSDQQSVTHIGSYFLLDDLALTGTAATAVETDNTVPVNFALKQNYPNPFNPSTKIKFDLPTGNKVKLAVYSLVGQEVAVLANQYMQAGSHEVTFNCGSLPSGIYLYKLTAGSFTSTKKMTLIK